MHGVEYLYPSVAINCSNGLGRLIPLLIAQRTLQTVCRAVWMRSPKS